MSGKKIVESKSVEESIVRNIGNEDVTFVFPTEVAAAGWADWTVRNHERTGVRAVAMERFVAWDRFKGDYIKAKESERTTVPSLMRKVFAAHLIEENAKIKKENEENGTDNPLIFRNLITRDFAESASSFSDWISKILPSLQLWKTYHDSPRYAATVEQMRLEAEGKGRQFSLEAVDDEDMDFDTLYDRYSRFLEEKKLFDPAWVTPPFESDGVRKFVIVYPQILEDWAQYEFLLKDERSSKFVSFVDVPQSENFCDSYFYRDSVGEIRYLALFLKKRRSEGISWGDISISVPDMDSYGTYIDRELELFEIPHSLRYSRPLTDYNAGAIFRQIQDCVQSNFSFDSVRTLLLNDSIPWRDKKAIERLVMFGKKNNCVCSYINRKTGKIEDVWEKSFRNPVMSVADSLSDERRERIIRSNYPIKKFYVKLKVKSKRMTRARTFRDLLRAYIDFRDFFIDEAGFEQMRQSNQVISRCISELNGLVELEREYKIEVSSAYPFFVRHISATEYLSQSEQRGIQVYPYRAAAAAPSVLHVVVDATLDSLSVGAQFKRLSFLNDTKRAVISKIKPEKDDKFTTFSDQDPSEDFIRLYQINSREKALFTSAEHSPHGYGFAHGFLKSVDLTKSENAEKAPEYGFDAFESERDRMCEIGAGEKIFRIQKSGFREWGKFRSAENSESPLDVGFLKKLVEKKFRSGERFKISASTLKAFFECPRKWLFKSVLGLKPLENEADLMNPFVEGKINHAIFEEYLTEVGKSGQNFAQTMDGGRLRAEFVEILKKSIFKASKRFTEPKSFDADSYDDTLSVMTRELVEARQGELFSQMLPAIEKFSGKFAEWKVYKIEEPYTFSPGGENFYFDGRIDCILQKSSADDAADEFCIVDFKTSAIPANKDLLFDENNPDKSFNFQMPVYRLLFGKNEKDRAGNEVGANSFVFFSIKNLEFSEVKDAEKFDETCKRLDVFVEKFVDTLESLDFEIDARFQNRKLCASKSDFGKECRDYQAVCRRFFVVSGR